MTTTIDTIIEKHELTPQEAAGILGNFVAETTATSAALPPSVTDGFSMPTWAIIVASISAIVAVFCIIMGVYFRVRSSKSYQTGEKQQSTVEGLRSFEFLIGALIASVITAFVPSMSMMLHEEQSKEVIVEELSSAYDTNAKLTVEQLRYTETPEGDNILDEVVLEVSTNDTTETVVYHYNPDTGTLEQK